MKIFNITAVSLLWAMVLSMTAMHGQGAPLAGSGERNVGSTGWPSRVGVVIDGGVAECARLAEGMDMALARCARLAGWGVANNEITLEKHGKAMSKKVAARKGAARYAASRRATGLARSGASRSDASGSGASESGSARPGSSARRASLSVGRASGRASGRVGSRASDGADHSAGMRLLSLRSATGRAGIAADHSMAAATGIKKGAMCWPVESRKISMHFGLQDYMDNVKVDNLGIIIDAGKDAAVSAVMDGTVDDVMDIGDAVAILVKHGNYFFIYSDLAGAKVTRGQQVAAGQLLGHVGEAGLLDFRLYDISDIWIDPEKWLCH